MPQFLLELHDDPSDSADVPVDQHRAIVAEYSAWAQKLGGDGRLVDGYKLSDDGGRVMRRVGEGIDVTDGPYSETKEILGGIFIVRAESYDDAVELARECPHVKYGSKLIVRMIDEVGPQ